MESKVSEIDLHSGKYSSPINLAIVYDVKKAREDRQTQHFVEKLELDNNAAYYNNKGLADSITMATNFQAQQATMKYYCDQIKRTEKLHKLIESLKEKIEAQQTIKKELLKNVAKG